MKKRSLIETLWYYSVFQYLVVAALLIFAEPYIVEFTMKVIWRQIGIKADNLFYNSAYYVVPALMIGMFVNYVFTSSRAKRYYDLTGRSYGEDHGKYKRTYWELVDYFQGANDYMIDERKLPNISWLQAEGIILAKAKNGRLVHVPSGKDGKNYMIFGLPSSGKTAGPIICSCLRFGMHHELSKNDKSTDGSVFCIDLKGDIYKRTHKFRNIRCFDLMHPQKSAHYNPFAGIENLSIDDRCNFIENIGFNIIPEVTGGDGKYFTETAYDFWNGIALYMLHQNINTSFPQVIQAVLEGNAVDWVKRVVDSDCVEAKRRLQSKWGENEKNLSGGYSNLAQSCRKFASDKLFFLLGNEPKYDYISNQTMEDGFDCYILLDQAEIANYACLLSMIVQGFLTGFMQRENNPNAARLKDGTLRPCLMCLDEFAQLSTLKYEAVAAAFMTLRSKNISIMCALQSRSSISEMFHSENACKSLIDCVTTFCFLSIQEAETRDWASKLIGTKKVLKLSNSLNDGSTGNTTTGRSAQEDRVPIVEPAEFGQLIDRDAGKDEIIIYSQGKYIRADKQYYFQ